MQPIICSGHTSDPGVFRPIVARHPRPIAGAMLVSLAGPLARLAKAAARHWGETVAAHIGGMDGAYSKRGDAHGRFATRLTGRLASLVHAGPSSRAIAGREPAQS
jgi:hypothetical protein